MNYVRSIIVHGKRWELQWHRMRDAFGECSDAEHTIVVSPHLDNPATVDTIIHEYLHARFPDLTEEAVNAAGTELSVILQRCGLIAGDEE